MICAYVHGYENAREEFWMPILEEEMSERVKKAVEHAEAGDEDTKVLERNLRVRHWHSCRRRNSR